MDDQPKEGAEGDKKIVHTYALVKVSKRVFLYHNNLNQNAFVKFHKFY